MAINYNKHNWAYGEEITPDKLNNVENGIKTNADAINEVNNNLTANTIGSSIRIGIEQFTFPSDGYLNIVVDDSDGYVYGILNDEIKIRATTTLGKSYGGATIFVRAGMTFKYVGSSGVNNGIIFYPLKI